MNILLAYHHSNYDRDGYSLNQYFSRHGHDVSTIPLERTAYWSDWSNRLPFYIPKGVPTRLSCLEKKFQKKFDLIVEFDSSGQYHITGLKKGACIKIFWSVDIYRKDKQKFHQWMEKDFDIIFVGQKYFLSVFKKKPTYWLPPASDPRMYKNFSLPKMYDVSFIGNCRPDIYPERARLLDLLSKNFKVSVFTNVYKEEAAKIYSQSKIVFNKSHSGDINMRVFEVLSCGSCLITDRLSEDSGIGEMFENGKHLVFYDKENDLIEKIAYYLQHEDEREKIALAGHEEVMEKHTLAHRMDMILKIVSQFVKK